MPHQLALTVLSDEYAVCRLAQNASIPSWADASSFVSITRTADELSVVCLASALPAGDAGMIKAERGWRGLKIAGPLDFALVGVLHTVTSILTPRGISVFVISTYDTDYVFVRQSSLDQAVEALRAAGHTVRE